MRPLAVPAGKDIFSCPVEKRNGVFRMSGMGNTVGVFAADFVEVIDSGRHAEAVFVNDLAVLNDVQSASRRYSG